MNVILIYPNNILACKAAPVENIDGEIINLADNMFRLMQEAKGIGLAANQVGVPKRLMVIDCSHDNPAWKPLLLINPEITHSEGKVEDDEGCLSVPGYFAPVKRAAVVQVKGYDRNGKEMVIEADGLLARCLQHEIDHLEGICFVERLGALKKKMFRKKWKKMRPGDIYVPEEQGK